MSDYYSKHDLDFGILVGKTFSKVQEGGDSIIFETVEGKKYMMHHHQDCCESVTIEDICGDLNDLVGSPIIRADENSNHENPPGVKVPEYQDSFTWTFYHISTAKGTVTIRWYGSSNGYYSESVSLDEIN